ncbi:MAG: hypothetical protein B9S30_07855 [Verrucomicrobiia bacterium Tous-C5FEB]|jgi:hypothetical protein|nr:MAG: hypothetical protein B9S30_07855 [Verrucomicrobiae bacterium Tous-C5FEB]
MQTTLRIDDQLYREAKAEAARLGVSLTRFLEEGLRLRLEKKAPTATAPHSFRTYAAAKHDPRSWEEIRRIADEEQEAHDLAKLGLRTPRS